MGANDCVAGSLHGHQSSQHALRVCEDACVGGNRGGETKKRPRNRIYNGRSPPPPTPGTHACVVPRMQRVGREDPSHASIRHCQALTALLGGLACVLVCGTHCDSGLCNEAFLPQPSSNLQRTLRYAPRAAVGLPTCVCPLVRAACGYLDYSFGADHIYVWHPNRAHIFWQVVNMCQANG